MHSITIIRLEVGGQISKRVGTGTNAQLDRIEDCCFRGVAGANQAIHARRRDHASFLMPRKFSISTKTIRISYSSNANLRGSKLAH
jgi:hypothetical protein